MANNTFAGLRLKVNNLAIRGVVAEAMAFRQQLTRKAEFDDAGGWDDPLNRWLAEELNSIKETLGMVTTQKALPDQDELQALREANAADENLDLLQIYNDGKPVSMDDIQMPAASAVSGTLPYTFDGTDENYPQMTGRPNVQLVNFCTLLDQMITEATRLSCQASGKTIPPSESAILQQFLNTMFAMLQVKGGQLKRREIADGTGPVEDAAPDVIGADGKPGSGFGDSA